MSTRGHTPITALQLFEPDARARVHTRRSSEPDPNQAYYGPSQGG
jgi:hypothetical protein